MNDELKRAHERRGVARAGIGRGENLSFDGDSPVERGRRAHRDWRAAAAGFAARFPAGAGRPVGGGEGARRALAHQHRRIRSRQLSHGHRVRRPVGARERGARHVHRRAARLPRGRQTPSARPAAAHARVRRWLRARRTSRPAPQNATATVRPSPPSCSESTIARISGLSPACSFAIATTPRSMSRRFWAASSSFASALNVPVMPPFR